MLVPLAVPALAGGSAPGGAAQTQAAVSEPFLLSREPGPRAISGVIPGVAVSAGLKGRQTEGGIGALMPWGGRLWFITYTSSGSASGTGTGLFWLDDQMRLHKHPASVVGTYANRFVHRPSEQMIIGPHVIDADNKVRTIEAVREYRLTATMTHLHDPANKVYMLGMESHLFEVDVRTLEARLLFTLNKDLALPRGSYPHYKGGFTTRDRVIVANNTYAERDEVEGASSGGRLAEWDGSGAWRILEETAYMEVNGVPMAGQLNAVASGWDRSSALLNVLAGGRWTRYRLPKASRCYDHGHYTEWTRIREVQTERFLMDLHGMFYELPRVAYGGRLYGVKPVCQHLRIVPDFCSWRGMLVLAGNQSTPIQNDLVGEPDSNLWFGKTDDLWGFGKPAGWGGPWYETEVAAGAASDPFLMTGFDQKVLHLTHNAGERVEFAVEVDFLGNGAWRTYTQIAVPANGYACHVFPAGFGAHWVRIVPRAACRASAQFVYT